MRRCLLENRQQTGKGQVVDAAITDGRTSRLELLRTAGARHVTMRQDGVVKAAGGETTVEEVLRATQDAEDLTEAGRGG